MTWLDSPSGSSISVQDMHGACLECEPLLVDTDLVEAIEIDVFCLQDDFLEKPFSLAGVAATLD